MGVCPGGYFCLKGVIDSEALSEVIVIRPYDCPEGSYCSDGSSSVIGTGFCPMGFYCPDGATDPIPADPGTFSSRAGAVEPVKCYPGYYTIRYQSSECSYCPSGHECKGTGADWPTICQEGLYRSLNSNVCKLCPEGSWSLERGSKASSNFHFYFI
jgi:hypothetical protein